MNHAAFTSRFNADSFFAFIARHKTPTLVFASALAAAGAFTGVQAANNGNEPQAVTNTQVQTDTTSTNVQSPTVAPTTNSQTNVSGFSDTANNKVKVEVNGQNISVPQNGSVHQDIPTQNGSTTVDVTSSTNGSASNGSNTSLNVNVSSNSSNAGSTFSNQNTVITG